VKKYIPVVFKLLVWCGAEVYVSGLQDAGLLALFCGVYGGVTEGQTMHRQNHIKSGLRKFEE